MPHDLTTQISSLCLDTTLPPPISVIGLGYVGAVSAACFASMRHRVVGVDLDREKISAITEGRSPIIETGLDVLIANGVIAGRLMASTRIDEAVLASDISFICVGTPSLASGEADLSALLKASSALGRA